MRPLSPWHNELTRDISQNLITVLRDNAGISTEAAMRKVTTDMLANNPFVPPSTGSPVNGLPNELLAYIFFLGTKLKEEEEEEDEDEDEEVEYGDALDGWEDVSDDEDEDMEEEEDEDEDDDDDLELPFQVLVSHVCRHWREIALESPGLWARLDFAEGPPFTKSKVWIQRSKGSPLDITIDCTAPEDKDSLEGHDPGSGPREKWPVIARTAGSHGKKYEEEHGECDHAPSFYSLDDFNAILDIIAPHVAQWRALEISVSYYDYMYALLARLASCPPAPLLETLLLYHYEDGDNDDDPDKNFEPAEFSTPFLIFDGIAPNLKAITLWGAHLDWERSLSLLAGLRDLELAYHSNNVRPSFATFRKILAACPELNSLTLCLSGPANYNDTDNDWGTDPIEVPSVTDLVLCYHEPQYIIHLIRLLCTPNVTSLVLDYDRADYSEFVQVLASPMPGRSKSLLAGVESLKIAGLPCNSTTAELFLDQLAGLTSLNLNCTEAEETVYFDLLWTPLAQSVTPPKTFCPNLHTIWTTGVFGQQMKRFIEARKAAGVPIKKVCMSRDDDLEESQERWIRNEVETLDFFDPSEDEYVEMDVDDMDDVDDGPGDSGL